MSEIYPWLVLTTAVAATAVTRGLGPYVNGRLGAWSKDQDLLSHLLPMAIILILVLKELLPADFRTLTADFSLKLLAACAVVILHLWQRNLFLSIIGGTAFFVTVITIFNYLKT